MKTALLVYDITAILIFYFYNRIRNLSVQVSEANLIGSGTSEHWVDDEGPQPKKVKVRWPW